MIKILLLSAYDAASHQYWQKGLIENFPHYKWQLLSLPGRYFNWRIRGNPLSWTWKNKQQLTRCYDLIIATSMVDLATIKGLNPNLANTPSIVYFHENQFVYPDNTRQTQCAEAKMVNLYSALCADKLLFNSDFNRQSFFQGIEHFLNKMPDFVPPNLTKELTGKSQILPVPLSNPLFTANKTICEDSRLTLVWNHRWEYDKGPERLYAMLTKLYQYGLDFKIHIIGQSFRNQPAVFRKFKDNFPKQIGHFGFIESKQEYYQILQQSHLALSTSIHEFQGLAVMEAVSQGCLPVVPDRLSYREIFPADFRYECSDNIAIEAGYMANKIIDLADATIKVPNMQSYSWDNQKAHYQQVIESFKARRL